MTQLACEDLVVTIGTQRVLRGVTATIRPGRLTGILGCNGTGKSTLLRTLLGYLKPERGRVLLDDKPLGEWTDRARAACVAYIAQGCAAHWPMRVEQVVALGRIPHGYGRGVGLRGLRHSDCTAIEAAMAHAGVAPIAQRDFDVLSGGERARVMLARALASEPAVLLADEPLAGLDPAYQLRVSVLLRQQARRGQAVALVLHDLSLAARFCDDLILLHDGRVLASGSPQTVLSNENLRIGFGIVAKHFYFDGEPGLLPWKTHDFEHDNRALEKAKVNLGVSS